MSGRPRKSAGLPVEVLLVSPLPPPIGGIARWTRLVTDALADDSRVRITVLDTALRLRRIDDRRTWTRIFLGAVEGSRTLARLVSRLSAERPDVVHLNTSGSFSLARDVAVARAVKAAGVPLVVHVRFGRVPDVRRAAGWEWRLFRRLAQLADVVIAIDAATRDDLVQGLVGRRIELIPHFAPERPPAAGERNRTAIFAGHVVVAKGVEDLLSAWSAAAPPGWELRVIGELSPDYRAVLGPLGADRPDVLLVGNLPHAELQELLDQAGLFVLPSHSEGFPNVVLEAMMAGAPILATTVGAIPQMLPPGTGVLVAPHDVDALTAALRDMTADDDRRKAVGEAGRARARREYAAPTVLRRYVDLWTELADSRRPR